MESLLEYKISKTFQILLLSTLQRPSVPLFKRHPKENFRKRIQFRQFLTTHRIIDNTLQIGL